MRIVAGRFKGTRLMVPKGTTTRPTTDRVRESLFNILAHSIDGFELEDKRVLDLFAGTGALGLEALSRGAAFALFVDHDAEARGAQRDNIDALGLTGKTRLFRRDALKLGKSGTMGEFGLVFLDPPYGKGCGEKSLRQLIEGNWLSRGAICVLEERADSDFERPPGFFEIDKRRYGESVLYFLQTN